MTGALRLMASARASVRVPIKLLTWPDMAFRSIIDFIEGMAMSANMAVIAITTIISIKVKPESPDFFMHPR